MSEYSKNKNSKHNHYNLPKNYFENFATQLMEQLPKEKVKTSKHKGLIIPFKIVAKYFSYAAACVAIIFSIQFFNTNKTQNKIPTSTYINSYSEEYIDDYCSYVMIDNEDIYDYMTAEN